MKTLDWIAGALLVIGGLNWLLVALFSFDLVAALFGLRFGEVSTGTRIVYALVGLSAIWELITVRNIEHRWETRRA